MPLLGEEIFHRKKVPRDLTDDEELFTIPFTQEIFRQYKDYIERLELYKQKVWTCRNTGIRGLTFEQAKESEQSVQENAESFPSIFLEPTLHFIQNSNLRVDELVEKITQHFKTNFVPGDLVKMKNGKKLDSIKVIEVIKGEDQDEYKIVRFGKSDTEYSIVKSADLVRTRVPFSKKNLKKKLRKMADKEAYIGSTWRVKDKYIQRYPSIPLYIESERSRKRQRKTSDASLPNKKIALPPEAVSSKEELHEDGDSDGETLEIEEEELEENEMPEDEDDEESTSRIITAIPKRSTPVIPATQQTTLSPQKPQGLFTMEEGQSARHQ
eukprot:TRINITY_DN5862_c0_g1_i1.p1 TRINITY_DN5862_c0_g1~~TRINITY_DN5862_c0_g1_i1.p1  ORF type:complete len:325 (-),score=75.25 TRINITY_DN5862_c0_g1_i1:62-1036(-)